MNFPSKILKVKLIESNDPSVWHYGKIGQDFFVFNQNEKDSFYQVLFYKENREEFKDIKKFYLSIKLK